MSYIIISGSAVGDRVIEEPGHRDLVRADGGHLRRAAQLVFQELLSAAVHVRPALRTRAQMVESLGINIFEATAHESRDLGPGPAAPQDLAPTKPGPDLRWPSGACWGLAGRVRVERSSPIALFQSFQLLGGEAQIAEGLQIVGTLGAMIDVDRDGGRDANLGRGLQESR